MIVYEMHNDFLYIHTEKGEFTHTQSEIIQARILSSPLHNVQNESHSEINGHREIEAMAFSWKMGLNPWNMFLQK